MNEEKVSEALTRLIQACAKLDMKAVSHPGTGEVRVFVDKDAAEELNGAMLDLQSLVPDILERKTESQATEPNALARFMMLEPIDA